MQNEPATGQFRQGDVLDLLRSASHERYQLVISSPPYNIGKVYERYRSRDLEQYTLWQSEIISELDALVKEGGSVCWQVGNYVKDGDLIPLDSIFIPIFRSFGYKLRNRIVWRFNFGLNADRRFSGRYETLLWFTKGSEYTFNLDPIRIPQIYPGKRYSSRKGPDRVGLPSGNPLGKNPSDFWEFSAKREFVESPVWEFPNVKANHVEKTVHPCQFPVELAERCVLAFTQPGDAILDPFVGTGASVIAAVKHGRQGVGFDRDPEFIRIGKFRLDKWIEGKLLVRPIGKPVQSVNTNSKVGKVPTEWLERELENGLSQEEEKSSRFDACSASRAAGKASTYKLL